MLITHIKVINFYFDETSGFAIWKSVIFNPNIFQKLSIETITWFCSLNRQKKFTLKEREEWVTPLNPVYYSVTTKPVVRQLYRVNSVNSVNFRKRILLLSTRLSSMFPSYRSQSIVSLCKSTAWFLYNEKIGPG